MLLGVNCYLGLNSLPTWRPAHCPPGGHPESPSGEPATLHSTTIWRLPLAWRHGVDTAVAAVSAFFCYMSVVQVLASKARGRVKRPWWVIPREKSEKNTPNFFLDF